MMPIKKARINLLDRLTVLRKAIRLVNPKGERPLNGGGIRRDVFLKIYNKIKSDRRRDL